MKEYELQNVVGGMSAALLSTLLRGFTALYKFGQKIGTIIVRSRIGKVCPVN